MTTIDVLIPTYNRPDALAVTLTSLCGQTFQNFQVIISDQTEHQDMADVETVQAAMRVLSAHGNQPRLLKHLPRRGIAEQRQFLLDQASAPYVLCLDDDILLESWVLALLLQVIQREGCGFVGNSLIGLSYKDDVRPQDHQPLQFWERPVQPESLEKGTPQWERWRLHNAANLYHLQNQLQITPADFRTYRVAWVAGCVLFDRTKLIDSGGFEFWEALPLNSCGEDVLAQQRVMKRYGGCGVLPSGAYHQELPTTIRDRTYNAPNLLSL